MYSPKDIDDRWSSDGSIFALKAIRPDEIADPELSFFWGLAKNKLAEFERAEDEIVRILEHRHSKGLMGQ